MLPDFSNLQVIVFGDVMLDRYWYGDVDRISPEAPVPVVNIKNLEFRPGGAANVALNIRALGAQVILFGYVGCDAEAGQLKKALEAQGVVCCFAEIPHHQTITKLRLIGHSQQLIRVDFEECFHEVSSDELMALYEAYLKTADVVILSDYAKGSLAKIDQLIARAKAQGKSVFIDPKSTDISCYRGATLLTPNRKEFEAIVGPCPDYDTISKHAKQLLCDAEINALLVTLGSEGMLLVEKNSEPYYLPAFARQVYDVTGAGDTVIAVSALAFAATHNLKQAITVANTAAGIVVGKLGTAVVSFQELADHLRHPDPILLGILSEASLKQAVASARASGERIVMTNGCFDILHAGHVDYLEKAKSLGDRLIVAVNDDASVKRLKGEARPFHPLAQRMQVLAALRHVDWVVSFSETTPERLISDILPDVLVKGGDYRVEQIAGHQQVLNNGGEVKILNFVAGCSTTSLVERIKATTLDQEKEP